MRAMALVDAHCHFDLFPNPRQTLLEAERNRTYSIAVTNTPSVFKQTQRLTEGLKYVRPAIGLHPELALQRAGELPMFERLVPETRYVGEVGLDYRVVVKAADRSRQRAVFAAILRCCSHAGGRILTVHSRRAEADVVSALTEYRPGPFILHWYSGSLRTLADAVAAGGYFSINAAMVHSQRAERLIREIPPERVLSESDGPFVEFHGKPASPSTVRHVVARLADIWGIEASDAEHLVFQNFRRLLSGTSPSEARYL